MLTKKLSFEQAFEKLESITKELEQGSQDLSSTVKLYREAIKLVGYCEKSIVNAEQEIILLEEQTYSQPT
ncbi:MAG: exodeoxyribonuclease VII small subunit [Oscillospiraceae bacterium]|jgi:exodeoxyribonuclease VII small subunit|nr:exodeoxyribonuclease VII small subunit [Oscillospiraceae bacterium]